MSEMTKEERKQNKQAAAAKPKKEKKQKVKVHKGKLATHDMIAGYLFTLPWLIGAVVFLFYPLGCSFWYSLNSIKVRPTGLTFVFNGYANYTQILTTDADFPTKIIDYLISTVLSVPIVVVFALIIAMMLNQKIKAKGFFRMIFFLPVIVVSGPILNMLDSQDAGSISTIDTSAVESAVNSVLPAMIGDPIVDLFSNLVTIMWYAGVPILIFLSALQKIDPAMYEAAKIDGGSGWECFWKITLPNLMNMILLNCVYVIIFISGNEQNEIIELIQDVMFSGDSTKGYGYASAMAWIYSIIVILIVGIFALIFMGRKDKYEKQIKKYKKQVKKEKRTRKKIERRSARNAKKIHKAREKRGYKTYDGSGDY